jgi:hypothetical protein
MTGRNQKRPVPQGALADLSEGMLCDPASDIADIILRKLSANDILKLKAWFSMERDEAALQEWNRQKDRLIKTLRADR